MNTKTSEIKKQSNYSVIETQRQELIQSLLSEPKHIPSKYFYDKKGSELFEQITQSAEYYPTKTEISILRANAKNITGGLSNTNIIELGSGDCSKISILLQAYNKNQLKNLTYIPIDISISAIEKSIKILKTRFPELNIKPISADFMQPAKFIPEVRNKLICFFGSTIGNLNTKDALNFLKDISSSMNKNDRFLLGADMVKNSQILEAAYNDKLKITAAFNKNILNNVNRILETDFKPDLFEHYAFFNKEKQRIEMHLKALKNMQIKSPYFADNLLIKKEEYIHTENSHKFTEEKILEFADYADLKINHIFRDKNHCFFLVEFIK